MTARLTAFVLALGLTACATAAKVDDKGQTVPNGGGEREIVLVIGEDGKLNIKGPSGAISERTCDLDPNSKNRCSIYDKRVQMLNIEQIQVLHYQVNPVCFIIGFSSNQPREFCL